MNYNIDNQGMIEIMNLNMSYQLKLEILNAVRKRNRMFAIWIELCGTISFLILLAVSLINATELREYIYRSNEHLPYIVTILSIIVSVSFDFVFKADKYKKNVELIDKIIKYSSMKCWFNKYFVNAIPLITEMDIARARFDYCKKLKVHKKLHLQIDEDKLQPVDLLTMNRQLYIIIALILEIVLFVALLVFLADRRIAVSIVMVMVLTGLIFMIIDSGQMKRAEKKVEEIYGQENYRKEDKDKMKKFYYISLIVGILIAVLITSTTAFAQEDETAYIMYDDAYNHFDTQGNFIYAITYNDDEDAYGLIDANGNVILTPKYERIECIDEEERVFLVTDKEIYFIIDIYGYKLSEYEIASGYNDLYLLTDDVLYVESPLEYGYSNYVYLSTYEGNYITEPNQYTYIKEMGYINNSFIVGCGESYKCYTVMDTNGNIILESETEEFYAITNVNNQIESFWGVDYERDSRETYTIVTLNQYDVVGQKKQSKTIKLDGYATIIGNDIENLFQEDRWILECWTDSGDFFAVVSNEKTLQLKYDEVELLGENYIIVTDYSSRKIGIMDWNQNFIVPMREYNGTSTNNWSGPYDIFYLVNSDGTRTGVLSNGTVIEGYYEIEQWNNYYLVSTDWSSSKNQQYLLNKDDLEIAYTFNGEYTLGPNNILYNIDGDNDYQDGSKILTIDEDKNIIELQIPYSDINGENDIDYYLERFIDGMLLVNECSSNWSGFVDKNGVYKKFIDTHCRLVPIYHEYQNYSHKYFITMSNGSEGIVDAYGNEILPCEYTSFRTIDYSNNDIDTDDSYDDIPCETGVLTTTNSNATSNQDEIHYYFDEHFNLLFQSSRTESGAEYYNYIGDGLWSKHKDDYDNDTSLVGIVSQSGTTIVPCEYSNIGYANGYAILCKERGSSFTSDENSFCVYDVKNKTYSQTIKMDNKYIFVDSIQSINEYGFGAIDCTYHAMWGNLGWDEYTIDTSGNIVFNGELRNYNGRTYKNGDTVGKAELYSDKNDYVSYYDTSQFYTFNGIRYFCARKEKNGFWGILDENNNLIVPYVLDWDMSYERQNVAFDNNGTPYVILYSRVDDKKFVNPLYNANNNAEAFDEKSKIIITPYDIENDEIASLSNRVVVLDGGTAHAYYKVTYDNGKPFANREIIYKYSGNDEPIITCTDKNGFLKVVAEDVYIPYGYEDYQHWFVANILTRDGKIRDNVSGSISFIVEVLPRPYTQEFTLTLGGEVEAGTGLGVELGAIDADVLKASAEFSKTGTIGVKYKHNSDGSIDLVLTSSANSTLKGEGKAGLFGSIWDGEDAPSISVGKNGSVSSGSTFGTQIELKNFFDKSNPNYKKMEQLQVYLF